MTGPGPDGNDQKGADKHYEKFKDIHGSPWKIGASRMFRRAKLNEKPRALSRDGHSFKSVIWIVFPNPGG